MVDTNYHPEDGKGTKRTRNDSTGKWGVDLNIDNLDAVGTAPTVDLYFGGQDGVNDPVKVKLSDIFAPVLGADENYVSDADLVVIGNTVGTNSGNQVGDGSTITGAGTAGDPFVSIGGGTTSPLTTKGDMYGYDTGNNRLPVGADTQVLTADSTEALGVKWVAPTSGGMTDPMTTRGDMIFKNAANSTTRLGVGTSGQVLTSDGTDFAWQPASGGGSSNTEQSIAYAATITPDLETGNVIKVGDLTADITVANPSNATTGEEVYIRFTMDSTGGWEITLGSDYVLLDSNTGYSTDPNSVFFFSGITQSDGTIEGGFSPVDFDLGAVINGATDKATPVDADEIGIVDSAASNVLKKLTWANLIATATTAFDLLYAPIAVASVPATGKTTMVDADMVTIWDSAATWAKKNITGTNLKAYLLTYFAGIFSNPNILINSDGSDPISQQYTLPVTGAINGYLYIDAWVLGHNIVGQVDVSVESDGGFMAIASSYTSGSSLQLLHRVINYSALDGETVTFAAMVRSNNGATKLRIVSNGSTVASSSPHSGEGGFELLTVTADLASTLTAIFVDVISESITAAGQYIEWSYTKLEIGSVPTKWTRDANCELNATAIQARYQIIGAGLAGNSYNTTGITLSGTLPVKMLSTPTLSVLKSTMTIGDGSGSGKTSSGSTATYRGDASGFIADVIGFTSLTAPSDPVKLLTGEVFALDANI